MSVSLTDSIQDYLKVIYELTEDGEAASTTAIATRLHIAPASVTGMMQKLASTKPALVEYRKHQGVILTTAGKRAALEVIRHHRLIEAWLVQTLGYSWDEVHNEAEKLEHVISEEFEERIASAMGYPARSARRTYSLCGFDHAERSGHCVDETKTESTGMYSPGTCTRRRLP